MTKMELSPFAKLALYATLIFQLAHTIVIAAVDVGYCLEYRRLLISERNYSLWTASWVLALTAEVVLLRKLSGRKNWMWALMLLLTTNGSVFLLLDLLRFRSLPVVLDVVLLIAAGFGFAVLCLSHRAYSVTRNDIFQVLFAVLLWAVAALLMSRKYWDSLGFYAIPGHALILWPQELQLLLCWTCYGLVTAFTFAFREVASRVAGNG